MIPVSFSFILSFCYVMSLYLFYYYNFLQKLFSYSYSSYYNLLNYYLIIFHKKYFNFSMFRDVPECSVFRVRVLSTPSLTCGAFEERSCLSGPQRKLIIMRKAWFPLSRNFYVRTCVKFTLANKIEAMYERSHVSVKVEPRSTSCLISTLYILPLFYFSDYNFRALTSVNVP